MTISEKERDWHQEQLMNGYVPLWHGARTLLVAGIVGVATIIAESSCGAETRIVAIASLVAGVVVCFACGLAASMICAEAGVVIEALA